MRELQLRSVFVPAACWVLLGASAAVAESETTLPKDWHYGAYLDVSYPLNFNFPDNHRWRSKVTTPITNEVTPNIVLGYVRKDPTPD